MLQIAKALSYLESVYIIHTEVAARNVLIKDDTAKLCDFGERFTCAISKNNPDEGNAIKEGKSHRRRRQESQRWDVRGKCLESELTETGTRGDGRTIVQLPF